MKPGNLFTLMWLLLPPPLLNAHGFASGTLIKAGSGTGWWTIEQTVRLSTQLKKQHVASYDPDTALWTNQRVTKGAFTTTNCACRLSFDEIAGHDIICAPTQLFYRCTDHTWVPAYELTPGDCLLSDGPYEVCVLDVSLIEEPLKLYTVEVEGTHTFLVGELSIVAHNMMVPVAAVIGVSIPFGMECGGSLGTFFGPPGIIGGILIGGVIGCLVKTYNSNQIREYSLSFNPETVRNHLLENNAENSTVEQQDTFFPTPQDPNKDSKNNEKKLFKQKTLEAAEELGFKKTNYYLHGQPVFQRGRLFITRDIDSHSGGFWNMADSIENLARKATRMGTYDIFLNKIGN